MAFRIHDSVVRGEIDNRAKGIVRGRIWVEGRAEPVMLELQGNAWPDLAGCLLTFTNSQKRIPHPQLDSLHPLQRGSVGDLTASRKVRVFDLPLEEAREILRRKEKPPEHTANCLYLEWFSEANGRVVIESADYDLTVSAPTWRLTPQEEEDRATQAATAMDDFMNRLTESVERHRRGQKHPDEEWDEHDYEKFLKECDARTDKYMELLDKYGDSDEAEAKIAKEMGWERELTEEEAEEENRRIEEINAACEEALKEPEPEPEPDNDHATLEANLGFVGASSPNPSRTRTAKALTGFAPRTAISATRCNIAAMKARLNSGIKPTNWASISWPIKTWSSSFLSFKPPAPSWPEPWPASLAGKALLTLRSRSRT